MAGRSNNRAAGFEAMAKGNKTLKGTSGTQPLGGKASSAVKSNTQGKGGQAVRRQGQRGQ